MRRLLFVLLLVACKHQSDLPKLFPLPNAKLVTEADGALLFWLFLLHPTTLETTNAIAISFFVYCTQPFIGHVRWVH